jgi:uncharacterized membrane protein
LAPSLRHHDRQRLFQISHCLAHHVVADSADPDAGREYSKIAKVRSTHNNYLTLPVVFLMLSGHYLLAFGA